MNRSLGFLIPGICFYALAEITPINDVVALFPIYVPTWDVPLAGFAYFTDFAKPLFMLCAVPALFLFFIAIAEMQLPKFHDAALSFVAAWTVILAIPDMIWPLGTMYYEVLKYYFGILSLILCFVMVLMFTVYTLRPAK